MAKLIAITGGIGCGKSIISQILTTLGYEVYDCDTNAKLLMNQNQEIKNILKSHFGNNVISEQGEIDRKYLADIVFNNKEKLKKLDQIVHPFVIEDVLNWKNIHDKYSIIFIETAILYQSGLDKIVDEVWNVQSPLETQIKRVINRNNISRDEVISRIESQKHQIKHHTNTRTIINDGVKPILPIILSILWQNASKN